ncbi:unnamed protein product [Rotaria magnacalcarata]|uniref:TGF-beta family profile domain-containing protein n=3 Tax=Rotaria magnacalcarata TaxID=392030 RepID=A0A814YG67_9BILA|nr:unnamed protein product [Rotaria magnacalcarata]
MTSTFMIINILLLLSSSLIQARYRAQTKRRYSMSNPSFVPPFPFNNNNNNHNNHNSNNNVYVDGDELQGKPNEESLMDSLKVSTTTPLPTTPSNKANEEQIEQFARLLFDRLNLKEAPNVTMNANGDTDFTSSIFKQFEQQAKQKQRIHEIEDNNFYRKQKNHDEQMPTAERAILPGDYIPNHTCERQLSAKFHLADDDLKNIDCFRFTKSSKESKSLPTNQVINELRLYVKKNYFHINEQQGQITPDMFHIYQIFRPTSNDTTQKPPNGLTGTISLEISHVRELNGNWLELTIKSDGDNIKLQQLYTQLLMPFYALAIDRDVQSSSSSSSSSSYSVTSSMPSFSRLYYRQYHAKRHQSNSIRTESDDENIKQAQQQLPYMLVDYGDKISQLSSGRRGTRDAAPRPARGCTAGSSCCRRPLTIDLDQGTTALNFVIYPRQLDIGECVGLCGTSGSSLKHTDVKNAQHKNEHSSAYNLLLLQNSLHLNRNATDSMNQSEHRSTQCCSYSRTGGLELLYTTTNGGPIIRKFIPNMVVEECKCGLPATIQQV